MKINKLYEFVIYNKFTLSNGYQGESNPLSPNELRKQIKNLNNNLNRSNKGIKDLALAKCKFLCNLQMKGDKLLKILSIEDLELIEKGQIISKTCFNFQFSELQQFAFDKLMTDEIVSSLALNSLNSNNFK